MPFAIPLQVLFFPRFQILAMEDSDPTWTVFIQTPVGIQVDRSESYRKVTILLMMINTSES